MFGATNTFGTPAGGGSAFGTGNAFGTGSAFGAQTTGGSAFGAAGNSFGAAGNAFGAAGSAFGTQTTGGGAFNMGGGGANQATNAFSQGQTNNMFAAKNPVSQGLIEPDQEVKVDDIKIVTCDSANPLVAGKGTTKSPNNQSTRENVHILLNDKLKTENISLLQLRYNDYIKMAKIQKPKRYSKPPEKMQTGAGQPDPNAAGQQQQANTLTNANQANQQKTPPDYKAVFNDVPQNTAPVNTAAPCFIPSKHFVQTRKDQKSGTSTLTKTVSGQKPSKNYGYLFEPTIPKSAQISFPDKEPIVITTDQLKCGKPQNYTDKVEIIQNGTKVRLERKGYGSIDFLKDFKNLDDFDAFSYVDIEQCCVDIKSVRNNKFFSCDLNIPAIITIEKAWPKNNQTQYRDRDLDLDQYENTLKNYCQENNITFIAYIHDVGRFIFFVNNFDNAPFLLP
ncbi:hypothetical protein TRFO_03064 [Tritrichomonas foetus]|uniref:Peptidase S59 domain-containing protein n=1 Tax=Tritrichomonas foetus TaxID=1144522 RepID=A0A1J4KV54_9EUKA|nr:hypothetical protein TRFO_03064 [Tritrichomonas foetus]|eukprot:OHT14776.1 hypothetical protein TRFO_03064 [Tritrichomonas foetus]